MKKQKITIKSNIQIIINPDLDKYDDIILFPKKLEKANRILKQSEVSPQFFEELCQKKN